MKPQNLFICLLLFLLTFWTKSGNSQIKISVIDDGVKLRLNDPIPLKSPVFDQASMQINLCGAKNEVLAFQVVVESGKKVLENLTLKASHLVSKTGIIQVENYEFFKAYFLHVTEPSTEMYGKPSSRGEGWYPDPLLPFEYDGRPVAAPFRVMPGARQIIWIDLWIPPTTPAGSYQGKIKILQNETLLKELSISVTVWNFALPDESHLKTFFYFGPEQLRQAHGIDKNSPLARTLYTKYMQMAHAHRFNLATDVYVEQNWQDFDNYWGEFLDGAAFTNGPGKGVGCPLWPVNIDIWNGQAKFQQQAKFWMDHFFEKGWSDKLFLYVIDEPGEGDYPEVRKVGSWLDDAPYPGNLLPFMLTEHFTTELVGHVDIWNSMRIGQQDIQKRVDSDDRFWTYNGAEPGSGSQCIDTDGLAMRTWGWIAWKGRREAWHYWDCCYFKDRVNRRGETNVWKNPLTYDQRPKGDVDWGNGDGTLFYPGQQKTYGINYLFGPVSSFRMKALRRGLQDYEYLWLAKNLGLENEVQQILESVLPYPVLGDAQPGKTCYRKDAESWHRARVKLAELILKFNIEN